MNSVNYITPENVCIMTPLIFAFWYLKLSLATKMKKLEEMPLSIIQIHSVLLYYYFAIVLFFFDARKNVIVSLILNGTSILCFNVLRHSRFIRDSHRLMWFTITHSCYTFMVNDNYWFVTVVLYMLFINNITFFIVTSTPLFFYILVNNYITLPVEYFILVAINISIVNSLLVFRKNINNEYVQKLKDMYLGLAIPFLITMLETSSYNSHIFFQSIRYNRWGLLIE